MIVKYGTFYISWFSIENYEFGVDEKHKAYWFDNEAHVKRIMGVLGLECYEVE